MAGQFYPADSDELKTLVLSYLDQAASKDLPGRLTGFVSPHAGFVYSGIVAAAGFKILSKQEPKPKRIIILGPSHQIPFNGAAVPIADSWSTPLGKMKIVLPKEHRLGGIVSASDQLHELEHSLEVQLPFIQLICPKAKILPIICCEVDPSELAFELEKIIDNKTVIIASSDLSHYLPYDQAVKIDSQANNLIPAGDPQNAENIDACGIIPILTLLHLAKKFGWQGHFVDYKNSGDTAGDKSRVVGYGCYAFCEGKSESRNPKS